MDARVHTVRSGEWVDKIASEHGTTRAVLIELNPWLSERKNFTIHPNEQIRLPGAPPEDDAIDREERASAPRAEASESGPAPNAPIPRRRPVMRPEGLARPQSGDGTLPEVAPLERPLRQGDEGPVVELLQVTLTERGYPTGRDGDYGPDTTAKVRAFQRNHGLGVDGVTGDNTWAMLFRDGPGDLNMNEAGVEFVERLRLDPEQADIDDYDEIAIAEAEHAQQLLIDAGYAELAPSITPELLKAMWFRESHLDPTANEGNGRGLGQITYKGFEGIYGGDYMQFLPEHMRSSGGRGWIDLARVPGDGWGDSLSDAWNHFKAEYADPELNASLSTVWLVAQVIRNHDTSLPLREGLEDYNGSRLRETYARQVMRLRNGYLEMVQPPAGRS